MDVYFWQCSSIMIMIVSKTSNTKIFFSNVLKYCETLFIFCNHLKVNSVLLCVIGWILYRSVNAVSDAKNMAGIRYQYTRQISFLTKHKNNSNVTTNIQHPHAPKHLPTQSISQSIKSTERCSKAQIEAQFHVTNRSQHGQVKFR